MIDKDIINKRFKELCDKGHSLVPDLPNRIQAKKPFVDFKLLVAYQKWIISVSNLLHSVDCNNLYSSQCDTILGNAYLDNHIRCSAVLAVYGLLLSAYDEWSSGLLTKIKYIVAAETFDDFLGHAVEYHKANKKTESSILASAVLEDTIKKIAIKNSVDPENLSLYRLIDKLVTANVFTPVKSNRIKSYADTRNRAFHAKWNEFDLNDVDKLIDGVRDLVENYLE